MASQVPSEFARLLVQQVRDVAIAHCDAYFTNKDPAADHWRSVAARSGAEQAIRDVLPDIVDHTLADLLHAIDEGVLHLAWLPDPSTVIDLTETGLGELEGWLGGGESGWLTQYARQRFHDYYGKADSYPGPASDGPE